VVTDLSRGDLRRIDGALLRQARAEALHFVLEARPPARASRASALLAARGVSLDAQVDEYLTRVWEPTLEGIDRSSLAELARRYLREAAEGSGTD
jgi:DNA repair protein SbcD/Mre11